MAEYSDSPVSGGIQCSPATAHNHSRRNNTNIRNSKYSQLDGAVSDGAAISSAASPHSKRAQHKQRSSFASGAISDQNIMGKINGHKQRPVSANAGQVLATPAKEQAYAGPTFQASPAASSLPMPRYFSRSLPNNAAEPSLQARLAGEKTPEHPVSSPESDVAAPVARESQQSPLDIFFQADRAEKERIRSGSGSLSPESARRPSPFAVPRNTYQQRNRGISFQELDGGQDSIPSTHTRPLDDRPDPMERADSSLSRLNESDDERQAKSKSLKELLFSAIATPPPSQGRAHSGSQTPDEFFGSPSPFHRSPSGPSTPQPSSDPNANYSLHYGNRNLSPLFKAARSETPPRPSSLRQEVPGHSSGVDPNTFARSYLQEQIRTSRTTDMRQMKFGDEALPPQGANGVPAPVPISVQPVNVQQGGVSGPDSPRGGEPDVRRMEDNLRRMLKIA